MKLRMLGSSIRLRLNRDEVRRIAGEQRVEEVVRFADGTDFRYSLGAGPSRHLAVRRSEEALRVIAPAGLLRAWADGDDVTLDCRAEDGGPDILVEKDFACLTPRNGDEDAFPHPEAGQRRC